MTSHRVGVFHMIALYQERRPGTSPETAACQGKRSRSAVFFGYETVWISKGFCYHYTLVLADGRATIRFRFRGVAHAGVEGQWLGQILRAPTH